MRRREDGSITVITIGFLLFIGLLAVVVINSSAAFLQRQQLDNLADGAALVAADGLSRDTFYGQGDITLDEGQARQLIADYVNQPGTRVVEVRTTTRSTSASSARSDWRSSHRGGAHARRSCRRRRRSCGRASELDQDCTGPTTARAATTTGSAGARNTTHDG
jgi:uncharacterized membrane protein